MRNNQPIFTSRLQNSCLNILQNYKRTIKSMSFAKKFVLKEFCHSQLKKNPNLITSAWKHPTKARLSVLSVLWLCYAVDTDQVVLIRKVTTIFKLLSPLVAQKYTFSNISAILSIVHWKISFNFKFLISFT